MAKTKAAGPPADCPKGADCGMNSGDTTCSLGGDCPMDMGAEARAKVVPIGTSTTGSSNLRFRASGDQAVCYLYGPIGASMWGDGISADSFRKELHALGNGIRTLDIRINSEGGDVFDGMAIYTLLNQHKANVVAHIDGLAASAASFIAMAADKINMAEGAFMMLHNARGMAMGDAAEMRRTADLLDSVNGQIRAIYASHSKLAPAEIEAMMNEETWLTSKDATAKGFADAIIPNRAVAASVRNPGLYKHLPTNLRPNRSRAMAAIARIPAIV